MFVTPQQTLSYGLHFLGCERNRWSQETKELVFHEMCGSSPLDVSDIWFDLVSGDYLPEELKLGKNEMREKVMVWVSSNCVIQMSYLCHKVVLRIVSQQSVCHISDTQSADKQDKYN